MYNMEIVGCGFVNIPPLVYMRLGVSCEIRWVSGEIVGIVWEIVNDGYMLMIGLVMLEIIGVECRWNGDW